ncbi:MAG TPA: class I SAM-dependent methyltransferase [Longimicrobium sp.]
MQHVDDVVAARVRREYAEAAARYDRRWAAYLRASMELVRPWLAEMPAGALLDVGCGTALLLDALRGWGVTPERYVGADPSPEMLRVAAGRIGDGARAALVCAPAEALPFEDGAFDTVASVSSLHYWTNAEAGLREMRRVLRPGGRVIVADWARDFATMRLMDAVTRLKGHAIVRTYAEREIGAMLEEAGLRVVRSRRKKIGPLWGLWVAEANKVDINSLG